MSPNPPIIDANVPLYLPACFPLKALKPHWVGLWLFGTDPTQRPTNVINRLLSLSTISHHVGSDYCINVTKEL